MKTQTAYDLSLSGELCEGQVIFKDNCIIAVQGGDEVFRHTLDGVGSIVQTTDVGCGSLELSPSADGENKDYDGADNVRVCRFSMSVMEEMGEFCKVVNYYLRTGEHSEIRTDAVERCPHCGRRYAKGVGICLFCVERGYVWRRTLAMLKPFLPEIVFSSLLLIAANLTTTMQPLLQRYLLDDFLMNIGNNANPIRGIIMISGLIALTFLFENIFQMISGRRANKVIMGFARQLRETVYDKVQRMAVSSMNKRSAGDLIKRVTRDTSTVQNFLASRGRYVIGQMVLLIIVIVMLFTISPLLTMFVLLTVPVMMVIYSGSRARLSLRYERQWLCDSRANGILHDIIRGIRVVKTFGNEEREISKFSAASKRLADIQVSNEHLWAAIMPAVEFLLVSGQFLVLFFGGKMVIEGKLTAGQLLQFTLLLSYVYGPLERLSSLPMQLVEVSTSLIKIFEVIDEKPQVLDTQSPSREPIDGSIEFKNVRFGYKTYEPVLRDIDLKVSPGEMIGLVGHSGAGKSTMINLVMRLYDADDGDVFIGGRNIRDYDQYYLRENIGVVFQETFLFAGTVYDNIAYAKADATPEEVIRAAKAANAHEFIVELKDGYNTLVGENGHMLSGGERQRVAIARAILRDPKILILDEATSALDPETESKIQEALGRLIEGRTTIAIAHRLSTLRHADRLVVLEHGRIAETGSHRELLEQRGIYFGLVMAQRQTSKLRKDAQEALN